ncbi:hypothetical protein VT50_0212645 [Streptomyces antioxidans]|uniref:Uncharacterized protein n=1 Tax=Streptomyces antioxidans TaxID=1507734 RepID=A0A1V4D6P4_9ACTN|nr:hypothetical protein VT50_0212645 [Streptomyces antioxidans]
MCQELTDGGRTSETGESVLRSNAVQRDLELADEATSTFLGVDRTYGGADLPHGIRGESCRVRGPVQLVPEYLKATGQVGMALTKLSKVAPHVQRLAVENTATRLEQLERPHCPMDGCVFVRSKSQCRSVSSQPGPFAHGVLLVTTAQSAVCHFGQQTYGTGQEIGCKIRIRPSGQ